MKNKLLPFLTLIAFALTALATIAGHRTFRKEQTGALTEPVKSVFANYLKIESALANESAVGIGFNASAIANAVRRFNGDAPPESREASRNLGRNKKPLFCARGIQAAQQIADPVLGRSQHHGPPICGSLLPNGEGKLDSKGQEDQQPLHGRFHARLRNDQAEARRIAIRLPPAG